MDEIKYVIDSYEKNFKKNNRVPLVIYGLGKNTMEIIKAFPQEDILGLMDAVRVGENVYGKKVLSIEEVVKLDVKTILILARSANVQIIYRRIANVVKQHGISVYDINGSIISDCRSEIYRLPEIYEDISEEKLLHLAEASDIVSFDIFDTLLVRDYLFPQNLFDDLKLEGFKTETIKKTRISAEQELYLRTNPTIYEIYQRVKEILKLGEKQCRSLLEQEIMLEQNCLKPRKKMIALLEQIQKNKEVYITSDMYLTREILMPILNSKGININEDHVLISCEKRVSKYNGLFRKLKEMNLNKVILHIGDNYEADVLAAKRAGIENTFYIKSVYGMLEDSKVRELLDYQDGQEKRKGIAEFINEHFDDPFIFMETEGCPILNTEYQMGYYFIAPVIICFVKWMLAETKKNNINTLLLGARDGYLIEKILMELKRNGEEVPENQYLYVSRAVCILAGIRNDDDILYASSLAFQGNLEQMLIQRFRLEKEQILPRGEESDDGYILRHKEFIYEQAEKLRERYLKYLKRYISPEQKYGFFDFVSSGSCQMGLEKILDMSLEGLYFFRIYDKRKEYMKIQSMYEQKYVYEKQDALVDKYFLLENIITSTEATLGGFDDDGNPIFMEEKRTSEQIRRLKSIHDGIMAAVSKKIESGWNSADFDVPYADTWLRLLDRKCIHDCTGYFKNNVLRDEFCNREFDVSADFV